MNQKMTEDGPFKHTLDTTEGVFRKVITNYKVSNGQLIMETATRTFFSDDYVDSIEVVPLCKVEDNET